MDKTQYDGGTDEDTYGSPNKRVARAGNSQENEGDSGYYSRGEQENGTYTYTMKLDPITSVLNYAKQVRRTGGTTEIGCIKIKTDNTFFVRAAYK